MFFGFFVTATRWRFGSAAAILCEYSNWSYWTTAQIAVRSFFLASVSISIVCNFTH